MANNRVYRTYRFIDKDPVIDEVRTIVQDEGLMKSLKIVSQLSGLSMTTLNKWFGGETRKPQNASVMAVITALGYERKFVKSRSLDVERELEFAVAWLKKERAKAVATKKRAKRKTA
jgi:hypothetical protein